MQTAQSKTEASKSAAKFAIFKQEDFSAAGRVVVVGYCVYEVATGFRVRTHIPTMAQARKYRDELNAARKETALHKCDLPPLPEPEAYRHREEKGPAWSYTAEQMHAYARAAIRAHDEAKAQPLRAKLCTPVTVEQAARLAATGSAAA